ncbi:MAG: DUF6285 domain-containing protein [Hyphomicrobiales bacterium]
MQDRPTATELLDALAAFMRDRAANARDRWERFQFQVAANSMGILERELKMDDGFMREEWRSLDELLGPEPMPEGQHAFTRRLSERNGELVERIQRGDFDGENEAKLLPYLYQTVVNKVRIASPNEWKQLNERK